MDKDTLTMTISKKTSGIVLYPPQTGSNPGEKVVESGDNTLGDVVKIQLKYAKNNQKGSKTITLDSNGTARHDEKLMTPSVRFSSKVNSPIRAQAEYNQVKDAQTTFTMHLQPPEQIESKTKLVNILDEPGLK